VFLGILASSFIFIRVFNYLENKLEHVPFVRHIYSPIKDFTNAFVGNKKRFDKPVLVLTNPLSNIQEMGFITQEDLTNVFIYYKSYYSLNYPDFFEGIGKNRTTTLDYINIKNLGILDYQNLLGSIHNAKPLTIRDRIAYARRHSWIPNVGHGNRKVRYA
jgi:hypothetical protein